MEPLSLRVEETIRLGFSPSDGTKLVGIYDNGYRLIRSLIQIRDEHKSPDVRVEARSWLQLIDEQKEIGTSFHPIARFIAKVRGRGEMASPRPLTWRKLGSQKHARIDEALRRLRERGDVGEQVRKKIDDLLSSVVGDKMPGHLYSEARTLLHDHKVTKRVLAKKINSASTYAHAIVRACQMCDNLSDVAHTFVLEEDRAMLTARLSAAALVLLKVQNEILEIGGRNDQARTRSDATGHHLHRDQEPLGGLGPGQETVQRKVGEGDS
jgi:DNA-binding transcriptional MerR regulator